MTNKDSNFRINTDPLVFCFSQCPFLFSVLFVILSFLLLDFK